MVGIAMQGGRPCLRIVTRPRIVDGEIECALATSRTFGWQSRQAQQVRGGVAREKRSARITKRPSPPRA
eukprot:5029203-Prymnesium_polylepis.1